MNNKQKAFIEEYLKDLNATQAAIRAGYSKKTARSQGQRLLTKVDIQKEIKKLQEEISNENIATVKDIEEFLTKVMNGEINEEVVVTIGTGEGKSYADKVDKQVAVKDRVRAAELLGKRHQMFTDKVDLDTNISIVIEDDYGD